MLNQATFVGRLTDDPAITHKRTGDRETTVARYRLAVDRDYVDTRTSKRGTDFIPIKAFGATAKYAEKYLRKGDMAAVTGRLTLEDYEKDGKRNYLLIVYADRNYFLKNPGTGKQEQAAALDNNAEDYEDYEDYGDYPPIPEGI